MFRAYLESPMKNLSWKFYVPSPMINHTHIVRYKPKQNPAADFPAIYQNLPDTFDLS